MTAQERGDLAEALLPEAAGLVVDVREATVDQIGSRLAGMSRHELEGLAVVLAAMADPDRSLQDALGWVDFDEHGEALPWRSKARRNVRDLVQARADRGRGVDEVAVDRALAGEPQELTAAERTLGVDRGLRRGLGYGVVAERLGMSREAVRRSWERSKVLARAEGRWVPPVSVDEIRAVA